MIGQLLIGISQSKSILHIENIIPNFYKNNEKVTLSTGSFFTLSIHTAHRLANMFTGLSYLYVYTNLVRDCMVGDSHSLLLRTIPLHGSYGDATHEFRHVHYIETTAFNSDAVQVDIRTDTGELAPFGDGKVLLTLDLQRHV